MLFNPVLDHLGAVPNLAKVTVDLPHHLKTSMAELAGDSALRYRMTSIERLKAS